jgi:hypothetical protein
MTQVSRRLEQIVSRELERSIIPVKTEEGILVGDILIVSRGSIKDLIRNTDLLYKDVYLNATAIKLANIMAFRKINLTTDQLYRADQEYGRWFVESQMLRTQHQKALNNSDYERADMLWARYIESRDRMIQAKNRVESLTKS